MATPRLFDDLRGTDLVSEGSAPLLTDKGREWLRALEELQEGEVSQSGEALSGEGLAPSISGLVR